MSPSGGREDSTLAAAREARLQYVTDAKPGIRRRRTGSGFSYRDPLGITIRDPEVLARIRALAIPPAWSDVWISSDPNGHLQATGRDARGRKQFRYHPRWRDVRDAAKFGKLVTFGRLLPAMRETIAMDLAAPGLPQRKIVALVVWFLEATFVRIGNEEYARANHTFGLTTLTNRHVTVSGATIAMRFIGKSGREHDIRLTNRRIARLVRQMRDLPGQELFQYVDAEGRQHPVSSDDVNAYLREISGADITAKDFRTWAGTMLAIRHVSSLPEEPLPAGDARTRAAAAVKAVAAALRNTPAVCRSGYIHPSVLAAWTDPACVRRWQRLRHAPPEIPGLSAEEAALIAYLEAHADVASPNG